MNRKSSARFLATSLISLVAFDAGGNKPWIRRPDRDARPEPQQNVDPGRPTPGARPARPIRCSPAPKPRPAQPKPAPSTRLRASGSLGPLVKTSASARDPGTLETAASSRRARSESGARARLAARRSTA